MSSTRATSLLLACLAAFGAAVWLLLDDGAAPIPETPDRSPRQPATVPDLGPLPAPGPADAADSVGRPETPEGEAQLWLEGRVFAAAQPLADARVELLPALLPVRPVTPSELFRAALSETNVLAGARSDPRGNFRIALPGPGRYQLSAQSPGWATAFLDVAAESSLAGLRLKLAAAQGIAGVVLDAAGQPVADARLQLLDFDFGSPANVARLSTRSDAQGRFAFAVVETPAMGYVLWAHAPDGRSTALDRLQAPQSELQVLLPPAGSLRGRLRLPEGPVEEAELLLLGEHGARHARSDPAGDYVFENLSAGIWQLRIDMQSRSWEGELELVAGQAARFDLLLEAAAAFELKLVDPAGAGVAGARVAALSWGSGSSRQDGHSDAVGGLRLDGLTPGAVGVYILAPGFAPTSIHLPDSTLVSGKTARLRQELQPAASLQGRLLDEAGEPWEGAVLRMYDEGWELMQLELPASLPSDAQGGFVLEGLPADAELELRFEPADGPARTVLVPGLKPAERRIGFELQVRR